MYTFNWQGLNLMLQELVAQLICFLLYTDPLHNI
jgi:hypothetical protein